MKLSPSERGPAARRLALAVIRQSSRRKPADAVLRTVLGAERELSPDLRRAVARLVFDWFRWLGWTDPAAPMPERLLQAVEKAKQFARRPVSFPDAELVSRALPAWLAEHATVTPELVRALQVEPTLWVRARPGTGAALARALGHCRPFGEGALADTLVYEGTDDLFERPEFAAGAFEIQDLGSQWVGWMCASRPGETWWDACAGEGGKTLHLSALMANRGLVWATDKADWRLRRLKRRAARAQAFNLRWALWDGGAGLPVEPRCDGVLVDAPCSGVGTWGRNPHARWTVSPQDVQELAALQLRLLCHAAAALRTGGRLIYAVCTLTRAETDEVGDALEKACPQLAPLPLSNPLRPDAVARPRHALLPQDTGGNGMWLAAWTRRAP